MSTIQQRVVALAQAIGADIKQLNTAQGDLTSLPTLAKTNLVSAIAELYDMANGTVRIDDQAGEGAVGVTYSVDKILDSILTAKNALKDELLGGAGEALDTLQELGAALGNDADFAATVASQLALRLRVDADQNLTLTQQAQGRTNLGAASQSGLTAVSQLVVGVQDVANKAATDIGDVATLVTSNKASVVGSINELAAATNAVSSSVLNVRSELIAADNALGDRITSLEGQVGGNVGDVSALLTTDKSSVVAAVNELVTADGQLLTAITEESNTRVARVASINEAVGLSSRSNYVPVTGSNFIDTSTSVVGAIALLDAAIGNAVTTLTADVAAVSAAMGTGEEDFADIYNTAKA